MTAAASIYHNLSGLESLRVEARKDPAAGVDKVARQFESLFVQMMLKSMRDATPRGGLFESDQMDMYQNMFDQQISLDLSRQGGIGLGATLRDQLGGSGGNRAEPLHDTSAQELTEAGTPATSQAVSDSRIMDTLARYRLFAAPSREVAPQRSGETVEPIDAAAHWQPASPEEFVREVWDHARASAQALGVDPRVLVAQSALETGWGKQVIRDAQGRSSYNLFGIKADTRWSGDAVSVNTLEYRENTARLEQASFRKYESVAGSFDDYVDF
ncbi:flagellar assembly peptidoglycan hydrolase FlgJ, partial [Pseudohalioglobus lutimaris]